MSGNTRLIVFGLGFLVAVGLGFTWMAGRARDRMESAIQDQAERYAVESLTALAAGWKPAELLSRADPEFVRQAGEARIGATVTELGARLGPLGRVESVNAGRVLRVRTADEVRVVVPVTLVATFERRRAQVRMNVTSAPEGWRIGSLVAEDAR